MIRLILELWLEPASAARGEMQFLEWYLQVEQANQEEQVHFLFFVPSNLVSLIVELQ